MIKCKISCEGTIKVKSKGTARGLAVETQVLINTIFRELHNRNPEVADSFRRIIIAGMIDPKSPVFRIEE